MEDESPPRAGGGILDDPEYLQFTEMVKHFFLISLSDNFFLRMFYIYVRMWCRRKSLTTRKLGMNRRRRLVEDIAMIHGISNSQRCETFFSISLSDFFFVCFTFIIGFDPHGLAICSNSVLILM